MSDLKFKKNKEDFVCEKCGNEVQGDGYTNHCPKCLFSKHIDIFPGDRSETCGGLMEPIGAKQSPSHGGGEWSIIHKCRNCGAIKVNRISKDDNFDEVVKIAATNISL